MFRTAFPRCTVPGSVDRVPYGHFMWGAIPQKCRSCDHLFEGGCTRAIEQVQGYLALDHGPCPIKGPTNPVLVDTPYYTSKVYVPSKCQSCRYLELDRIRGFVCNYERERWGSFPQTLDWGLWNPAHPNLGLKSGRSVPVEFIQAVQNQHEAQAVKAFRSAHPDTTFREARDAYAELLAKLQDDLS